MENTDKKPEGRDLLHLVYGDVTLGIHGSRDGAEFHYLFSYTAGGMESLVSGGMEWLYRPPRPCFWRASTDNDRGNGFVLKSGMWLAADQFIRCGKITIWVDGEKIPFPSAPENNKYTGRETASKVRIAYTYETVTVPPAQTEVFYEIDVRGAIQIRAHYHGMQGLPELPLFGMRFVMPTCADGFTYEGLSGETYPDRKAGGIPGIYKVKGLPVTPYLVPQDCGMHMDTAWVEIQRSRRLDNRKSVSGSAALRFQCEKAGCLRSPVCPIPHPNWKMPSIRRSCRRPDGPSLASSERSEEWEASTAGARMWRAHTELMRKTTSGTLLEFNREQKKKILFDQKKDGMS